MFENYTNPSNSPPFYWHERNELDLFLETTTYSYTIASNKDVNFKSWYVHTRTKTVSPGYDGSMILQFE